MKCCWPAPIAPESGRKGCWPGYWNCPTALRPEQHPQCDHSRRLSPQLGRPVRTLPDPLPASGKRFEHSLLPVGQALAGLSLCRPGLSLFTALSCRVDHGSADWNLGSGPCLAPHCRTLFRSYLDCAKRRTAGRRNRRQQKKHWKTTIKVCIMVISFTVPAGERKGEDHYAVPQRY